MRSTMLPLRHYIWPLLMFSGWWGLLRKMGTPGDVLASPGIAALGWVSVSIACAVVWSNFGGRSVGASHRPDSLGQPRKSVATIQHPSYVVGDLHAVG